MMKSIKIAGVFAALALLTACASNGPDVDTTGGAGTGAGAGPVGPVPGSQADFEQASGDHRVYFAYDQYTLTSQAQGTLARQAAWLKEYPQTRILVAGNCDERGTREYNLALGARRAEATRAYLVSLGIDASRITTVSYGKERPVDPRSTEAAWSVNRNSTSMINGASS